MEITVNKTYDREAILEIAKTLPEYFSEQGLKAMEKDLEQGDLFGVYEGNEMIGFVVYKELSPEAIEMAWLGVKKEYQGRGIGKKLVQESVRQIEKQYKVCQVKTLSETHPDEGYAKTRNFYKQLGFIALETIQPYPGWSKEDPCQIFVKCLRCES